MAMTSGCALDRFAEKEHRSTQTPARLIINRWELFKISTLCLLYICSRIFFVDQSALAEHYMFPKTKVVAERPVTQVNSPPSDEASAPENKQSHGLFKGPDIKDRYVTIDFDDVDIEVFIKFFSEITGRNFVIDKGVKGKVTIISPTSISIKESYKVFESVLEVHGFAAIPAGNIIKIVPAAQATSKGIETGLRSKNADPEDRIVTQLIPLDHADPDRLKELLSPLTSKSSIIVSYPPTSMLIITDVLSNIRRLIDIIEAIDTEGTGEEISIIPLEYATASDMAKSISSIFIKIQKSKPGNPVVRVVPDIRTNSLIISSSEEATEKVRDLIRMLDKNTPRGEGGIHVCYLQNADAEGLAKILTAIPGGRSKEMRTGKTPGLSGDVRIVPDKATNSLVITAKRDDFLVLEEVIKKLDIPRRMVYLEVLIMEVNVKKDFDLGVEWRAGDQLGSYGGGYLGAFIGSGGIGQDGAYSTMPDSRSARNSVSLPTAFSVGVIGTGIKIGDLLFPTLGAVVRAYQKDSDVHILSTPQIMTTDNEEAEIKIGKNVPYITRQETSTANIDYTSYEYKDVGVSLKIIPQINQEKFVRLKLFQEVTRLIAQEGAGEGRPTTFKRSAQTTVIVKDASTVVIGGLIGDDVTNVDYKVPFLGDIPILGHLFKSITMENEKTNLFIFLTPHIIENQTEADKVYKGKRQKIEKIKEGVIRAYKRKQGKEP